LPAVAPDPPRIREIENVIQGAEKILSPRSRNRTPQEWRTTAAVLRNVIYVATDVIGEKGMVLKLAHAVEMLLKAARRSGISDAEVEQMGVHPILDEARRLRAGVPPGDEA
jgi:hypothetical protein